MAQPYDHAPATEGKLLEEYLCHVFFILQESDDVRQRMENLILTSGTFQHITTFLRNHRSVIRGLRFPPEAKMMRITE
jgi:hypothetical protein